MDGPKAPLPFALAAPLAAARSRVLFTAKEFTGLYSSRAVFLRHCIAHWRCLFLPRQ
eukprot:COSAG05_NODE_7060_length_861_cov_1.775591_1_plen_56_part_10